MLLLIRENFRHILRSKLFLLFIIFSTGLHFFGLKILHNLTLTVQGVMQILGVREGVFISLYFQLFCGVFLAAVYGIWMVPYAHSGARSSLTFTLPVSKWKFPIAYALTFLGLILIEQFIMFGSFAGVFGSQLFSNPKFPWQGLFSCIFLELLAFQTALFAFALSSMVFGQIPTFFFGMISFFTLQTLGSLFRFGVERMFPADNIYLQALARIYKYLPPVGEIIFDLREGFNKSFESYEHFGLWIFWFVVFVLLFRWKLRYPSHTRSTEG